MNKKDSSSYNFVFFLVIFFLVGHVFLLNAVYDPLWYFDGNKVGRTYTFDEKIAKVNRINYEYRNDVMYDCVILGSSRLLTFDQALVKGYNCYNFSSSSADFPRMISHAKYFKSLYPNTKLVIVGIDDWHFTRQLPPVRDVPAPEPDRNWVNKYFGIDALRFSKRYANDYHVTIGYDQEWRPVVVKRVVPGYVSNKKWSKAKENYLTEVHGEYYGENKYWLEGFRDIFQNAKLVGFISPIAEDWLLLIDSQRMLSQYCHNMYSLRGYFDEFFDFTFPNRLTKNTNNTWDGSHFYPKYTEYIVNRIFEGKDQGVLRLQRLKEKQYCNLYSQAVRKIREKFLPELKIDKG